MDIFRSSLSLSITVIAYLFVVIPQWQSLGEYYLHSPHFLPGFITGSLAFLIFAPVFIRRLDVGHGRLSLLTAALKSSSLLFMSLIVAAVIACSFQFIFDLVLLRSDSLPPSGLKDVAPYLAVTVWVAYYSWSSTLLWGSVGGALLWYHNCRQDDSDTKVL